MNEIAMINRAIAIQRAVYLLILFVVSCVAVLFSYWYFEPDPLTVSYVENKDAEWSECNGRRYEFKRLVVSVKDLDIYVQERWHDLDGMMNYGTTEGELVIPRTIHYPLGKDFKKVMTFSKSVPRSLPIGRYEYRPYATYAVNPIKTITKPLPVQRVHVHCEYDSIKHGVME